MSGGVRLDAATLEWCAYWSGENARQCIPKAARLYFMALAAKVRSRPPQPSDWIRAAEDVCSLSIEASTDLPDGREVSLFFGASGATLEVASSERSTGPEDSGDRLEFIECGTPDEFRSALERLVASEAEKEEPMNPRERAISRALSANFDPAQSCPASSDPLAAQALLNLMQQISEDYWSAGWASGLEYTLGDAISGQGVPEWMESLVSEEEAIFDLDAMRCLYEAAGGWWVWTGGMRRWPSAPEHHTGAWFVSREEWEMARGLTHARELAALSEDEAKSAPNQTPARRAWLDHLHHGDRVVQHHIVGSHYEQVEGPSTVESVAHRGVLVRSKDGRERSYSRATGISTGPGAAVDRVWWITPEARR